MRYVTSFERLAKEEGIQKGSLEKIKSLIQRTLKLRFGDMPVTIVTAIETINNVEELETLHDLAVTVDSLALFMKELPQVEMA